MKTRRAEAFWYEPLHRWQINVQRDGVRKTFTDSTPGKKGKHLCEGKADKWLERFVSDQSISNALDLFLEDKRRRVEASTYRIYKSRIDSHIRPYFAPAKRLSAITEYDWQSCLDEAGYPKVNSQKQFIATIENFISYCQSRRWDVEPVRNLTVSDKAQAARQKQALTADEIQALLAYDPNRNRLADYFKLAVLTGCRRGELLNLKWQDVEPTAITIRKGKTANAARQVPLIDMAQEVLQDIRARAGFSEYLFANQYGERIGSTTIDRAWREIRDELGFGGYTIHELRHTFISVCKGQVNMTLLKKAVGHSAAMDTIGVYGHTMEQDIADVAEETAEAFDRIIKK